MGVSGRRAAFTTAFWCAAAAASALDASRPIAQYTQAAWGTEQGLPQATVQALAQTPDGYLWAATLEGLARFDGVRFSIFDRSTRPELPGNDITVLLAARNGDLWFVPYGGGLVRYRDGGLAVYTTKDGLVSAPILCLAEAPDGSLWIGTHGQGLQRLKDGEFSSPRAGKGLLGGIVRRLVITPKGDVWAAGPSGLARLAAALSAGSGPVTLYGAREGLADTDVTALTIAPDGRVWVGTSQGLHLLERGRFVRYGAAAGLCHDVVRALRASRDGSLWVGTDRGLGRLFSGRFECLRRADGLSDDAVTALLEDSDGSLWVGTYSGGLNQLKDGTVTTYGRRQGLAAEYVYTLAAARRGGVWAGADNGEVTHLDGGRVTGLGATRATGGSAVVALHEDRAGRVWVGTERGLLVHERGRWRSFTTRDGLPHPSVRAILEDEDGRLWVGTDGGGVAILDRGRFASRLTAGEGLAGNQVRSFLRGKDGGLWIATYGGVSRAEGGRVVRTVTVRDGLSSGLARSLYEDNDGTLWIGTYGGGLNRLRDGRITTYGTREGLFNDTIYHIADDGRGRLWMTCNRGIFSVSKRDLEDFAAGLRTRVPSSVVGRGDGMKSVECNGGSPSGWKSPDGRLWFPTVAGVAVVDPDRTMAERRPPAAIVEEARVDGELVAGRAGVTMEPGARRVEVRFTAPSFIAPESLDLEYRLDGFDVEWTDAGRERMAQYTSLPPGDYRFRVRAVSRAGVFGPEASAQVHVGAVWHETRGFWISAALALVLAGGLAHRARLRGLRARERELCRRVEDEVAKLKVLRGLLPICASCKRIRDDNGYWSQIELYIRERSEAEFSHGLCPECIPRFYPKATVRRAPVEKPEPVGAGR